jgi:outer membrane immunogenic protein
MNKMILAGAALAIAGTTTAGAANAADMPLKAPIYAPVFTWTGLYLGANAGYGWQDSTGGTFCTDPTGVVGGPMCPSAQAAAVSPKGGFVGGQLGYNYQSGMFVWGVEADIQVSHINDSFTNPAVPFTTTMTRAADLDWYGTVRGRLGIAFWDRALIYGTGGVMYGEEVLNTSVIAPVSAIGTSSSTHTGWVAGAGLEYAFTNNLSGKVEGLFYNLGSQNTAGLTTTGFTQTGAYNFSGSMVRIGMNVKFGP